LVLLVKEGTIQVKNDFILRFLFDLLLRQNLGFFPELKLNFFSPLLFKEIEKNFVDEKFVGVTWK
jgi:hypothetical protein